MASNVVRYTRFQEEYFLKLSLNNLSNPLKHKVSSIYIQRL